MATTLDPTTQAEERKAAFTESLLRSVKGTFDVFSIYLGDQLGYYRALREGGAATSTELSARAGTDERYAREWLEHQAVAGILAVDDETADATERRYELPEGIDEALADSESLDFLAPLTQVVAGAVHPLAAVKDAHRRGGGVPYEDFGEDLLEGQGRMNRMAFLRSLGEEWIPAVPDVDARLRSASPPARVADFGCGVGWSAIGMARAYPHARVDGFDLDPASIRAATSNALAAGLDDRVRFELRDAADAELLARYDLVTAFECVHDMSDPVGALSTLRKLLKPSGSVLVMDERAGERFTAAGNEIEPLLYGFSILHCLPAGMADEPSAGTGTVMRPATLEGYARDAGFESFEVLPIDNFFFRFYRMR